MIEKASMTIEAKGDDTRVIKFAGTTNAVDRDGEILTADGWDISNYQKNPVFLWGHDYRQPPIGKALAVRQTIKGLEFDIEFADASIHPFADTIYKLYKGGFMHAVSVGFQPKSGGVEMLDGRRVIKQKELYELSAVTVPANAEALMLGIHDAVTKGIISEEESVLIVSKSIEQRIDELEARVKAADEKLEIAQKALDNIKVSVVKYTQNEHEPYYLNLIKEVRGAGGSSKAQQTDDDDKKEIMDWIQKIKGV